MLKKGIFSFDPHNGFHGFQLSIVFQDTLTEATQDENNGSGYSLRHRRKAVLLKGVIMSFVVGLLITGHTYSI